MSTRRLLPVYALLLLGVAACKKPQVEVEEEGPPLPLPQGGALAGSQHAAGASPMPGGARTEPDAPTEDGLPISYDEACRLVDTYMGYVQVDIKGRRCAGLRVQGDSLRLDAYEVPVDASGGVHSYNFCLWPREQGDGWEVGYVDEVPRPCVDRSQYCRVGASGVMQELSMKGCPGDQEHYLVQPSLTLNRLQGRWVAPSGDSVLVESEGRMTFRHGEKVTRGHYTLKSTVLMEFQQEDETVREFAYAFVDGALYLGPGYILPSPSEAAFTLRVDASTRIRRFRGVCYDVARLARDYPQPVPCTFVGEGPKRSLVIVVNDHHTIRMRREGDYWMDAELRSARYTHQKSGSEGQ